MVKRVGCQSCKKTCKAFCVNTSTHASVALIIQKVGELEDKRQACVQVQKVVER